MLKRWHCYALSLLILVVIVGIWLLCCYVPLERKLAHVTMQLDQARKDIVICVRERHCIKQFEKDIQLLQVDYQTYLSDKPSACKQLLYNVISKASECDLQIISLKKGDTYKKDNHHICLLHLQAQGTLQKIYSFFEHLTLDNHLLVRCSDCKIQRETTGLYTIQAVLKQFVAQKIVENESPSTLEKAEGLGG